MQHYTSNHNCVCEQCGTSFHTKQSALDRGRGKYCSRICFALARQSQVDCICLECGKAFQVDPGQVVRGVGKYCSHQCHSIGSRKQIDCNCEQCGTAFQVANSIIERGGGKFCSKNCMGISMRGENHPFWKGGVNKYRGPNWSMQRKLAYARDKGICQNCNKKPQKGKRKFQVHHIKPFRTFSGDYVQANELTNLITLCQLCHAKAERGNIILQPYLL